MGYLDDGDPSTFTGIDRRPGTAVRCDRPLRRSLLRGALDARDGRARATQPDRRRPKHGAGSDRPGNRATTPLGRPGRCSTPGASGVYAGFIDVTTLVAAAGSGSYSVADVQSATGQDRFAAVGSRRRLPRHGPAPAEPGRVRRPRFGLGGYRHVEQRDRLAGLRRQGPVRTTVGGVGYEGDRGASGVSLRLETGPGSSPTASTQSGNFYNSTISSFDVLFTDKSPDFQNQLGFDADLVTADGILPNGATSAVIRASSSADSRLRCLLPPGLHVRDGAARPGDPPDEDGQDIHEPRAGPASPGDTLGTR